MKKVIINENQKGFLFKNGKFVRLIGAGKYYTFGDKEIEKVSVSAPVSSEKCSLDTLLGDASVAREVSVAEVGDQQLGLHFVGRKFAEALRSGKYAYWNTNERHEFQIIDISAPEVGEDIPKYIFSSLPLSRYIKIEVAEYEKGRLYFDKKFVRILEPGTYYFWRNSVSVEYNIVDTRLTQLNITGQEIMTLDKVSIRVNFVCNYRITDYIKVLTEIDNYTEQIHIAAQLLMRDYVGKYKLDDILAGKEKMSEYIFEHLKEKAKDFFVNIADAGVKDIILPGEIREIMNTVLIAEKKAQASVITRREEVASTRSLLNTAKLMDENKTLYKLKELEYIERICENVGNINLNGNADVLSQLTSLLQEREKTA